MAEEPQGPTDLDAGFDAGLDPDELYRLQQQEDDADESRGGLRILSLVLILLAGLVILMLSACPGPAGNVTGVTNKAIVPVPDKPAVEGSVSLWIQNARALDRVLRDAGIADKGSVSAGKGRFVIQVEPGTEAAAVLRLRQTPGVIDAGLVYDGGTLKKSDVQ